MDCKICEKDNSTPQEVYGEEYGNIMSKYECCFNCSVWFRYRDIVLPEYPEDLVVYSGKLYYIGNRISRNGRGGAFTNGFKGKRFEIVENGFSTYTNDLWELGPIPKYFSSYFTKVVQSIKEWNGKIDF